MYEEQPTPSSFRFSLATALWGLTFASIVFAALSGSLLTAGLAITEGCLFLLILAAVLQVVHEFRSGKPSQADVIVCTALAIMAAAVGISLGLIGAARL